MNAAAGLRELLDSDAKRTRLSRTERAKLRAALAALETFQNEAAQRNAKPDKNAPHPFQLTAAQWVERARETLHARTQQEDDMDLIDAHDDLCNALQVMGFEPGAAP